MSGTVLILGASGRFGRHAAEAFWNAGWRVRLFQRDMDTLAKMASGADVIVNGWNPAYPDWEKDVPCLTADVIDAAKTSGATVILPGNVYVYGADSPALLTSGTPHRADNPLGRIRIEMEAAYRRSGVQTIVLRAGDFIDTEASGNWFDGVITAKVSKGIVVAPGNRSVPHAWAYLPDLARAAVQLAERREELSTFEDITFPGLTLSLDDLARLIETATGRSMRLRSMPWWALKLAIPFWPMARHLLEMRYLWDMPHRLDGARFYDLLPRFQATDALTAVATALDVEVDPDEAMARSARYLPAE